MMQFFIYFWLLDVHSPLILFETEVSVDTGSGLVVILSSLSATFTALIGGIVSDKIGRKKVVYVASVIQCVSMLLMVWVNINFLFVLGIVTLYGVGLGMYQAVEWALINDVLPDGNEAAKDLGIWQVKENVREFYNF